MRKSPEDMKEIVEGLKQKILSDCEVFNIGFPTVDVEEYDAYTLVWLSSYNGIKMKPTLSHSDLVPGFAYQIWSNGEIQWIGLNKLQTQ